MNVAAKVGLVERYRSFLPVPNDADIVTLDEGSTPLVRLHTVSDQSRNIEVYAKCEGLNQLVLSKTGG